MSFCLIGFAFVFANLVTMLLANYMGYHTQFIRSLGEEQKETYFFIKNERMKHYLVGTLLGILLATVLMIFVNMKNTTAKACVGAVVLLFTQYVYYSLAPKTKGLMVQYLDNEEQKKLWVDIYHWMRMLYVSGMVFGVFAYFFFVKFALCEC